jgi:hypothetical protein
MTIRLCLMRIRPTASAPVRHQAPARPPGRLPGPHGATLALRPSVDARAVAIALTIAAFTAGERAEAGVERPVFVTITGQGVLRLRLAAGITAPCDSSDNRMLFDGRLGPGRYRWDTGAREVCYQYTSRALPDSDWSESRVISTTTRAGPLEIVLSTD